MRVKLLAKCTLPFANRNTSAFPISVTIRPANNLQGTYVYQTDCATFLRLLRRKTDLRESALLGFASELHSMATSRIPAVTFNDDLLREIGYYID